MAFGIDLAVHITHEIGELIARLKQFRERRNLTCDGCRTKILDFLETQAQGQLFSGLVAELVWHLEGRAGLDRRHPVSEIVHVDIEEDAIGDLRLLDSWRRAGE